MMMIFNTTTTNYNNSYKVDTAYIEECGRRFYELAIIGPTGVVVVEHNTDLQTAMLSHWALAIRFEDATETEGAEIFSNYETVFESDAWED